MDYESYAVWWVPRPETALARFGAEWTGWCADGGVVSPDPAAAMPAIASAGAAAWSKVWAAPRALVRRGLHAALRPAFELAPGRSRWALEDALAELADCREPILLPRLELSVIEGRVALAPARPDRAISGLLSAVAEAAGPFARPLPRPVPEPDAVGVAMSASAPGGLHLPLTDRLEPGCAQAVLGGLEVRLAPVLARRHWIADLALVGDPGGGRPWRLLQRLPLSGETAGKDRRVPSGMASRGPSLLAPLAGGAATT